MVPHLVRAAQSSYNLKRYNYSHFITHTHTHTQSRKGGQHYHETPG